ncbi:alpha-D-ribose 1-methylphosphonate 5-triphosphate synthase subunit PhnL [Cyclobacterium xiamenense]|uniref:Alpha-D-ribose 1-methylphosphonate 5-triphosphate synthase subunit PhnL n=1 Tax=Cyclobacterium xiamenense TaxID=1297121 RepID=A0A1H6TH87_9BACT|nr:ATP-binding cassette domain-containing protein [Cyclobacterium xiamenense]SEI79439.1 alpha-D-ribose 1-methylphosphonate 5-triphosphate synthase subunit PhnL [Cyclobacterium xiamenense]
MKPILEIEHLRKEFLLHNLRRKRILALDDISLTIREGEVIGLVGKSGSGKSTLMKCIYRTYLSSTGSIKYHSRTLGATDLVTATDHEVLALRKLEITYCPQFLIAIPRVPAVEIVAAGLRERKTGHTFSPIHLAKEYLLRMGLPGELTDAYPATFSGGEQQRINVARAIISQPRFLLIDEPTASLDLQTKNTVIDMILELRENGSSVLLISHDEHTLHRMCDRVVELVNGKTNS